MALPTFDATKHDIGIGGYGWIVVRDQSGAGSVARQDAAPATARTAIGEGRDDRFLIDSFYAQRDFGGGAGQSVLDAKDRYANGYCDSRFQGHVFPARKKITSADGVSNYWAVPVGTNLYGFSSTSIENIVDSSVSSTRAIGTTGAITCKPIVTASQNIMFLQGTNLYRWDRNFSNAPVNVAPANDFTPSIVARYGRWTWTLGTRLQPSTILLKNTSLYQGIASALIHTMPITQPRSGRILLAQIGYDDAGTITMPDGWSFITRVVNSTLTQELWYKVAQATDLSLRVEVTTGTSGGIKLAMIVTEWQALNADNLLDQFDISTSTSTNATTASISNTQADALVYAGIIASKLGNTTIGAISTYTELTETTSASLTFDMSGDYKIVTAIGTQGGSCSLGSSVAYATIIVALRKNSLTTDITELVTYYSVNDGSSWIEAFNYDGGSGIEAPVACHAAMGKLWFTNPVGLYALTADEKENDTQISDVLVSIAGPYDEWQTPKDTGSTGTWVTVYDGIVYYCLGGSVRRFAPNGQGEAIWPSENWGVRAGKVQAVTTGEGGLYFSSDGTLWNYNGTGFFPLAKEPTAGAFDYLTWFKGRIYGKGDPAPYLDFGYPAMRPDLYDTTATNFETGYWVSSAIELDHIDLYKIIAEVAVFAEFSATSNSGSVEVQWLNADTSVHPERYTPDSATPTWVSLGTLSSSDGVNVKRFTATVIEAKKIYLRVILTPGTSGYPILEGITLNGDAQMPRVLRFPTTFTLSTNTIGKDKVALYKTKADVMAALTFLKGLRYPTGSPRYFTVQYVEPDKTVSTYTTCIAEQLNDMPERWDGEGVGWLAQFVARQVPNG